MTELIIGAIILFIIIYFVNQSNEKQRKIEDEKKRLEKVRQQAELQKRQEEEKRQRQIQERKNEEQRKLNEAKRLEKERLQKIEDEKYETLKIVVVGQRDDKFTCVLERLNKTYAYVERPNTAFQLDSNLKLLKETANQFKWISQVEHNKKQEQNKLELKRQDELKKELIEKQLFDEFWKFIKPDNDYYEIITNSVQNDKTQPFSVYTLIQKLSRDYQVWNELGNGVNILTSKEQLSQYIFSYGKMHKAKLNQAFETFIPKHFKSKGDFANIIDYGCGQGLGTVALIDFLDATGNSCDYSKTILIEPSIVALQRASTHVVVSLDTLTFKGNCYQQVFPISKKISEIVESDLQTDYNAVKFHIFSNILDIDDFDLKTLSNKIISTQKGVNYFICISPNFYSDGTNIRNQRLRTFLSYFNVEPISHRFTNIGTWTRYEIVFKVDFAKFKLNKSVSLQYSNSEIDDLPF